MGWVVDHMKIEKLKNGDFCFFYHSDIKSRRVVSMVEVVREWYEEREEVDAKTMREMKAAVGLAEI